MNSGYIIVCTYSPWCVSGGNGKLYSYKMLSLAPRPFIYIKSICIFTLNMAFCVDTFSEEKVYYLHIYLHYTTCLNAFDCTIVRLQIILARRTASRVVANNCTIATPPPLPRCTGMCFICACIHFASFQFKYSRCDYIICVL